MSKRSEMLADRLTKGAKALAQFAGTLTDAEWKKPVFPPRDLRPVGVIVHHVASVYPIEVQLAQGLGAGKPMVGVTWDDVHAMNAAHAKDNAATTKQAALALLEQNSAAAAAAIRKLSDAELDSAAPASMYLDAPVTCQFMLEDHAVRHSYYHLGRIRAAVGR